MNRLFSILFLFLMCASLAACTPPVPPYPHNDPEAITKEAKDLSDRLEQYIEDWFAGKVPASIPSDLLPKGFDNTRLKNIRLQKYEDILPAQQWMVRKAEEVDFKALHGYFPDPHATYLKLGIMYAPFGSRLVLEGEFPHSRFFNIQVSPSFNPNVYYYDKRFGSPEVPIVDADIDPLPGNQNPFRVGVDRGTTNRKYKVVFNLAIGNPVELNPSFKPPYYRGPGNIRTAGAIQYQGPWGVNERYGHNRGLWDAGDVWIRYYGVDKDKDYLGGVPLPKAYYELPDGRKYFINADYQAYQAQANETIKARITKPAEPLKHIWGPTEGWSKQFGIFLVIAEAVAKIFQFKDKEYIRKLDLGVTGRGEDQPPPGNYEPSNSTCTYINYLTRGMSLGPGKVAVFTGKLPTFPDTRNGLKTMSSAQMRYWSITSYDANIDPKQKLPGAAVTSVMDDELILDKDRRYIIVYSREKERPSNATAENGITWVNWGPTAAQAMTLRWMSIAPEWSMPNAPNEKNLPWTKTSWSGKNYDKRLIGENNHSGYLGEYLPRVHYLTKAQFEKLGKSLKPEQLPLWN